MFSVGLSKGSSLEPDLSSHYCWGAFVDEGNNR